MKKTILLALLLPLSVFAQKIDVNKQFKLAEQQYQRMLADHPDTSVTVHSANHDGTYRNMPSKWWCSGFFPGGLWQLYERSHDAQWEKAARLWTAAVEKEQFNTGTHDLGFMMYDSFGQELRLTKDPHAKQVLIQSAKSLATRFDPAIGLIKSWNSFKGGYKYPVIIDNMMNLELLHWVSDHGGDPIFKEIAVTHANTTIANQFTILGGEQGVAFDIGLPPARFGEEFSQYKWFFWICALAALLMIYLISNLLASKYGRIFRALRDNSVAASLSGINVGRLKVVAFSLSAGVAGLAGGLLVMLISGVSPSAFPLSLSFSLLTGAVVTGVYNLKGVMLGGLILVAIPEIAESVVSRIGGSEGFTVALPGFLVSALLILAVVFTPNGPGHLLHKKKH